MNFAYSCKKQLLSGISVKRPIIPVELHGNNGLVLVVNAILDSGSDFTLIPKELADELALEYDSMDKCSAESYEGEPFTTTKSSLRIIVRKGRQQSLMFDVRCMVNLEEGKQHSELILGSTFFGYFRIHFNYPHDRFQILSAKGQQA